MPTPETLGEARAEPVRALVPGGVRGPLEREAPGPLGVRSQPGLDVADVAPELLALVPLPLHAGDGVELRTVAATALVPARRQPLQVLDVPGQVALLLAERL